MLRSDGSIRSEYLTRALLPREGKQPAQQTCLPQTRWGQKHLRASLSCLLLNFKEMQYLGPEIFQNGQIVICQNLVRSDEILLTE